MSPIVQARPVTSGLLAMLRGALDYPVGDHDPPLPSVEFPEPTGGRYVVLRAIPGGEVGGTYGEPQSEVIAVFQADSSARSREQCQWLGDRVRMVMLSRTPAGLFVYPVPVEGWVVSNRAQQTWDIPENEGRDELGTSQWTMRERYELSVVPE